MLAFPVASARAGSQVRQVLDGLIIVAALLVVSWDTVLGAVFNAGADSTLKMVLSLLYPLSDIAIITMVLLRVGKVPRGGRTPLLLVAVGLACAAVADSSFAYLIAAGTYGAGSGGVGHVDWREDAHRTAQPRLFPGSRRPRTT